MERRGPALAVWLVLFLTFLGIGLLLAWGGL